MRTTANPQASFLRRRVVTVAEALGYHMLGLKCGACLQDNPTAKRFGERVCLVD
jgi:hypothetical protein